MDIKLISHLCVFLQANGRIYMKQRCVLRTEILQIYSNLTGIFEKELIAVIKRKLYKRDLCDLDGFARFLAKRLTAR